jgi:hypothetical protein
MSLPGITEAAEGGDGLARRQPGRAAAHAHDPIVEMAAALLPARALRGAAAGIREGVDGRMATSKAWPPARASRSTPTRRTDQRDQGRLMAQCCRRKRGGFARPARAALTSAASPRACSTLSTPASGPRSGTSSPS